MGAGETVSTKVGRHIRAHAVGYLALFVALSGTAIAAGGDERAGISASAKRQIKQLKQRVAALEARPDLAAGAASGDLSGAYPAPQIAADAVGAAEVDGSLGSADISTNALTGADIDETSLGATIVAMNPGTPISAGGLTITPSFPQCQNGGNMIIGFALDTSVANARVGAVLMDNFVGFGDQFPDYVVDGDFDPSDNPSMQTGPEETSLRGHLSVEYTSMAGLATDRTSVQLFFRGVNSAGSCSFSDVVGRVIG